MDECELCQHEGSEPCLRCTSFADKWELKLIYKVAPALLETLKEINAQFGYCLPEQYATKIRDVIAKAEGK